LGTINPDDVVRAEKRALAPFERDGAEGPYATQTDLQEMMQDLVGIVRQEREMLQALERIQQMKERAERVGVSGNREYNPGWHTAIDLHNLLTVSEIVTRAALERKESRGAHFRDDYPNKDQNFGSFNIVIRKGPDGEMQIVREPIPEMPPELKQIIEEMK
jgi:succinate dehydrogenase / fumarate reductase, flavoprotein subunit